MDELKPCPFCGSSKQFDPSNLTGWWLDVIKEWGVYFVHCPDCDARGPSKDTEEEAINAWNSRGNE